MVDKSKLTEQEIVKFLDEQLEVEFTLLKSEEPAATIASLDTLHLNRSQP